MNSTDIDKRQNQGRAKWKTRAQLEQLKREGKCFRCERQGCITKRCPLLPARKPIGRDLKVNMAALPEIDPSVIEYDSPTETNIVKSEN